MENNKHKLKTKEDYIEKYNKLEIAVNSIILKTMEYKEGIGKEDLKDFEEELLQIYNIIKELDFYKKIHEAKKIKKMFLEKFKNSKKLDIGFLLFTKILDNIAEEDVSKLPHKICAFVPHILYSLGHDIKDGEFDYKDKIIIVR